MANTGFSQEEDSIAGGAPVQDKPEVESIYGEVLSVNEANNSISVQYYDYDTDEEESIELEFDKDTKLENAAALKDIKAGDWVDADYSSSPLGKKIAGAVKVELAEDYEEPEPDTLRVSEDDE